MIYRAPLRVDIGEAEQALRGIRRALSSIRPSDRTTRAVALNNRGVAHEKLGRAALARCAYRATIPEADRGSEQGIRDTARENLSKFDAVLDGDT
jgi:hypothetical protein